MSKRDRQYYSIDTQLYWQVPELRSKLAELEACAIIAEFRL